MSLFHDHPLHGWSCARQWQLHSPPRHWALCRLMASPFTTATLATVPPNGKSIHHHRNNIGRNEHWPTSWT
eukprot:86064-Chlamydomonas_euryale.AAC.1